MNALLRIGSFLVLTCAMAGTPTQTTTELASRSDHQMMVQAKGSFEIKMLARLSAAEGYNGMSLDKTYSGDLQATAKGEFLSAGDPKTGNAGYVAMERITGTLAGHPGSFAVMQLATMRTGTEPNLTALIVPGSGTGDLSGIHGSMTLTAAGKDHHYTIEYGFSN